MVFANPRTKCDDIAVQGDCVPLFVAQDKSLRWSSEMLKSRIAAFTVAGAIVSAAWVSAQDNQNQPQPGRTQQEQSQSQADRAKLTDERPGWQNADQLMASCITIQNLEEVALAKLAEDKLQNEEVKKFAAMMQEQHQAYLTKLEKFASEAARQPLDLKGTASRSELELTSTTGRTKQVSEATPDDRADANKTTTAEKDRTTQSDKSGKQIDLIQIDREIAQECLNAAKAEMEKKEGVEADQCFLGYQIAKHAAMKTKLTVFERHASPELAKVFAEGAATAEKHKNEAEEIMKSLASADTGAERRAQRRETREDRREDRQDDK
jgi:predicted outer membrane protein